MENVPRIFQELNQLGNSWVDQNRNWGSHFVCYGNAYKNGDECPYTLNELKDMKRVSDQEGGCHIQTYILNNILRIGSLFQMFLEGKMYSAYRTWLIKLCISDITTGNRPYC